MAAVALETSNTFEEQVKTAVIGKMCGESARVVVMHTQFGGTRMIDVLVGDPLLRIYKGD